MSSIAFLLNPLEFNKKRKRLNKEQLNILENLFNINNFPDKNQRIMLSHLLNITPRSVQICKVFFCCFIVDFFTSVFPSNHN